MTHMSSMSCPSLLQTAVGHNAVRGFIPHGTLHFFTGVQRVRCPCLRNGLLPFQHGGLWSWANHVRRKLSRAVGLHPLSKWSAVSTYVDSTAAHRLARGTGCGRPLGDLAFGTYFLAGGSSPESSRRRSRPAVLLAVHCVSEKPTASHGVRPAETGAPGCRAGMRSLRSDQPRARTVYCAVGVYPTVRTLTIIRVRLALTEPARGSVRQV